LAKYGEEKIDPERHSLVRSGTGMLLYLVIFKAWYCKCSAPYEAAYN